MVSAEIQPGWHFCGIALVLVLFWVRRQARATHIVWIYLFEIIGVWFHEYCHVLVSLLFGADVRGICLFPRQTEYGWTMGSVEISRINAFNAVPIALAPLLLIPFTYLVIKFWGFLFPVPSLLSTLGMYGTSFLLLYDCLPSQQDLRIAANWKSIVLYGSVAGVIFYWKYV